MTPQPPQAPARTPSSLPVIALICAIFCWPIGLILGIVALVQNKGSKGLAIAAVVIPVVFIPVIGILAAIAIPNFIKFQSRSKQSECKVNLRGAYMASQSYQTEKGQYAVNPAEIGWSPERGNRYLYAFALDGPIAANTGMPAKDAVGIGADTGKHAGISNDVLRNGIPAGVEPGLRGEGITIVCVGNIDNDDTLDVWSVSSEDRPGAPPGTPRNDVNDVTD